MTVSTGLTVLSPLRRMLGAVLASELVIESPPCRNTLSNVTSPEAGNLKPEELQAISQKSCGVLRNMGPQIQWVESFVTADKIYCVYIAPDEQTVREHSQQGGFPRTASAKSNPSSIPPRRNSSECRLCKFAYFLSSCAQRPQGSSDPQWVQVGRARSRGTCC